jgi:hypothetical protein
MAVPKGYTIDAASSLPQGYVLDSPDSSAPSTPDFTTKLKGKENEGLYAMEDANGKQIPVPFSRVDEAGKAGYKFSNKITIPNAKGREDYAKDRFATLQPAADAEKGADPLGLLEGRLFKGGKVVKQTPIPEEVEATPGLWSKAREAFAKAAVPTGANRPTSHLNTKNIGEAAWNFGANSVDTVLNAGGSFANTLFGTADMIPQVVGASKDLLSHDTRTAVKGMASLVQMMPASMVPNYVMHLKELSDKNPSYAVSDLAGTALGMVAAGKATEGAVKAVSDPVGTFNAVKGAPRKLVNTVTNTSPETIKEVGKDALGKAIEHKESTLKELGKRSDAHDAEVKKVNEHNDTVREKHKLDSEKIQRERDAAEHALELRRAEEAKLKQQTEDYYAKNDATKAKVKASADAKWQPVHQALDAKTIDGGFIEQPLEKIRKVSPEVQREINQLIPDPSDAEQGSPYVQKRNEILKAMGHKEPQAAYDSMDDFGKANVDRAVAAEGLTPDPIDLDPKSGVDIPFDKIHRAQSIIARNIRNGRYGHDGPLLGEMQQLQKTLYNAESKIAADNGLSSDLDDARQATREYKEAFGIEKNKPLSNDEEMEQRANPEQFKEKQEQKQVDAANKHDPTLAEDYEKVKAQREKVKKHLDTEDQLRKSLKQPIPPPSLDHPIDAYRLKPDPEPFTGKPQERDNPNAPRENDPQGKTLWTEDALKDKNPPIDYSQTIDKNIDEVRNELKKTGLRRALYATLSGLAFAGLEAFKGSGGFLPSAIIDGFAAGGLVLGGTQMIASILEKPGVREWITKVTPQVVEEFNKLPAEQKALFTEDMQKLADAAKSKGVSVSPALTRFLNKPAVKTATRIVGGAAGFTGANKPSPEELKKKADELYEKIYGTKPEPFKPDDSTGPQSSAKPNPQQLMKQAEELQSSFANAGLAPMDTSSQSRPIHTHVYDEATGKIVPV